MKKASILLFTFFLLLFVSCSDENVYRDSENAELNLWRVQDKYFATMQDAADYIIKNQWTSVTKALGDDVIPEANTAHLLKNVLDQKTINDKETDANGNLYRSADVYSEDYRKGLAITDKTTTGKMKIDFGGYRYDFYYESTDKDSCFFKIDSGEKIDIMNGQSVIFNEADHNPYAISVDAKVVTIDAHLLDDRRVDDGNGKAMNNLIYVGENGHLKVEDIQPTDGQNIFGGKVSVVTDGENGAILDISTSKLVIDDIFTMYKTEEEIPDGITIKDSAKSHINIYSGDITINAFNKQSDYFNGSTVFDKAVITFNGTKEDTTVHTSHDVDKTIEEAIDHSTGTATHLVIHHMEYHAEVPATCTTDGVKEYWTCSNSTYCKGVYYLNEQGTESTTDSNDLVIPALGHNFTIHVERKESTCTEAGNIEYWHCDRCDKNYSDDEEYSTNVIADVVLPAKGHSFEQAPIEKSTYEYDDACHWLHCTVCGKDFYKDSTGSLIEGTEKHGYGEWSDDGTKYIRTCNTCDHYQEKPYAHTHMLVYHPAADPTCTENGNIEYWQCSICHKYFSDAKANNEITEAQTVIAALGHNWSDAWLSDETSHWHVCLRCGAKTDVAVHTGDGTWLYDDDRHWQHCSVCGHLTDCGDHLWGEREVCEDKTHYIYRCTVCRAIKNEDSPTEVTYEVDIGTIHVKLPETPPCGDMVLNGEIKERNGSEVLGTSDVVVEYHPHINSTTNYKLYCYYIRNGRMVTVDASEDGKFHITLTGSYNYQIELQAYNSGGTITMKYTVKK